MGSFPFRNGKLPILKPNIDRPVYWNGDQYREVNSDLVPFRSQMHVDRADHIFKKSRPYTRNIASKFAL